MKLSIKPHHSFFAVLCLLTSAGTVFAQAVTPTSAGGGTTGGNPNPTMASGFADQTKEAMYAQFNDYKRNPDPNQQRNAYPAAKNYLRRWGGEHYASTAIDVLSLQIGRLLRGGDDGEDWAREIEMDV